MNTERIAITGVLAGIWLLLSPASMVPAMAQSTPEECAAMDDSAKRLLCYDALFRIGRVVTPSAPSARNWSVRTDTSRIDDSRSVFLSTGALDPYMDDYGTQRAPILTVRCMENTTSLIINFDGDYMSDSRYWGPVLLRVDDHPASEHDMQVSTDNHALGLWRGGAAIPAIKSLLGGERLLVRATPVSSSAITVEFNISGLDQVIAPLREACGW